MTDLVQRLEGALHDDASAPLTPDRLAAIRRDGRRRRSRRRAGAVAGAALAVAVLGGATVWLPTATEAPAPSPAGPPPSRVVDPQAEPVPSIQASPDLPPALAALQRRILDEIPGAVRSSPTQVDLPDPRVADPDLRPRPSGYRRLPGAVGLGVQRYVTPRDYLPGVLPDWLATAWADYEEGSTVRERTLSELRAGGVRVPSGEWRIACESGTAGPGCRPVLLSRSGMTYPIAPSDSRGAETWLGDRGPDVLYAVDRRGLDTPGEAATLAIVGVARDDVTGARFTSSTGETVEARVDTTLAPGTSIVWAAVPGGVDDVVLDGADGSTADGANR